MAKKQFKTESKRLLDLMINSVYTNKEIFLRELISNASDALDKRYYKSLTDGSQLVRSELGIRLTPDKESRTLTISDNGIGMTRDELEANLGTIAKSGTLAFKQEANSGDKPLEDMDIIGQFGVGFYSAFMVAKKVSVLSRAEGRDEAWLWESEGLDGYTVTPGVKDDVGTTITLYLKDNADEENYDTYLEIYTLRNLVTKYSDYIRYPIKMLVEVRRPVEEEECECEECECEHDHEECECEHDHEECECEHEHTEPKYETVTEDQTLNSMVPLWRRNKNEITDEDYTVFYTDKFHDYEAPLHHIHYKAEGAINYNSILFIPSAAPYNLYSKGYKRGLQLYSNGVMIMESCEDLLPEYFGFVKGLVDSSDISLNISRELLQQSRQLRAIANGLKKKIKSELEKLLENDREKYEKFFKAFGLSLKYGIYESYGMEASFLQDLLLFYSARENRMITFKEYVAAMIENQTEIYYACGSDIEGIKRLPQLKYMLDKGYDVLLMPDNVDEFCLKMLNGYDGKPFKSITDNDLNIGGEDEKKAVEEKQTENKELLDAVKEALSDKVHEVRLSARLGDAPAALTSDGPISLEMEKILSDLPNSGEMRADRILELNPDHPIFGVIQGVRDNEELFKTYAELLYDQALLLAGLKIDDPAGFAARITRLMVK
ncbi:MAG: molecular chaperone HtpG [Clostridium sp.]|nr:molecular chaperone HtpG [Clostridium sp.]